MCQQRSRHRLPSGVDTDGGATFPGRSGLGHVASKLPAPAAQRELGERVAGLRANPTS